MTQYNPDHEAQPFIERAITMTPRDHSREDFERRIQRMLSCLADVGGPEGSGQALKVELLGFAGDAGERTLCFRYRLVPATSGAPLLYTLMA